MKNKENKENQNNQDNKNNRGDRERDALDLVIDLVIYLYKHPNYELPPRGIWLLAMILQERLQKKFNL